MHLDPGHLTLTCARSPSPRSASCSMRMRRPPSTAGAVLAVAAIVERGEPAYGINTGFGRLAQTHIPHDQLELLQRNLVLSHAVGVGAPLPAPVVRLTLTAIRN